VLAVGFPPFSLSCLICSSPCSPLVLVMYAHTWHGQLACCFKSSIAVFCGKIGSRVLAGFSLEISDFRSCYRWPPVKWHTTNFGSISFSFFFQNLVKISWRLKKINEKNNRNLYLFSFLSVPPVFVALISPWSIFFGAPFSCRAVAVRTWHGSGN
jgi:hypothetical protein